MAIAFDPAKHVIVNLQNRPTTVFDRQKHPVTVQPYRDLGAGGQRRNTSGTYILTDPHFAQFVGGQGPLYLKPKSEVETHLGAAFQAVVGSTPLPGAKPTGTPVGKSAASMEAEAVARHQKDRAAAYGMRVPAPVVAPAAVIAEDPQEDDPDTAPEVELHTLAELEDLSMEDLRAYADHWNLAGRSRKTLIDKLAAEDCIAADDE